MGFATSWGLFLLCFGVIAAIFGSYELAERKWLIDSVDAGTIHILHMVRGIGTSLLIAIIVAVYFLKKAVPILPDAKLQPAALPSEIPTQNERMIQHAAWFIQMRWIAVAFALAASITSYAILRILPAEAFVPLLVSCLALLLSNVVYARMIEKVKMPYRFVVTQVLIDLLLLTCALAFSGGIENPLYLLFLLHSVIAGILLSRRHAFEIASAAFLLPALMATGQMHKIIPHYSLGFSAEAYDSIFILGRLLPLGLIMCATTYLITLIAERAKMYEESLRLVTEKAFRELEEKKIVEAQLLQSSKMAAIGELTGRIAHEINNPIAIIGTKAKLLLADYTNGSVPPRVLADLEKIDKHAERIATITKGLLAFSRPSIQKKSELDINEVVRSTVALVEESVRSAGIILGVTLHAKPLLVCGNAGELQQVLLNLINNALDATQRGAKIEIRTNRGSGSATISVSDSGGGIRPENLDRIFDPFFSTKQDGKGTGLGLSISMGLVRSHGGTIEVKSDPGKGSTFTVLLPELTREKVTQ